MPQEPYEKCDKYNKVKIKNSIEMCIYALYTLAGIILEKSLHIIKCARPAATKIAPNIIPVLTPMISGHTVCIA